MHAEYAFLVRPGGPAVVGFGPFRGQAEAPAGGVAFFRTDFGLRAARPWQVPARWEVVDPGALAARLGPAERPGWQWAAPDAAAFAAVFQQVTAEIRRGAFEKTVPVAVERGRLAGGEAAATALAFARPDPACFGYAWVDGARGFAGATPEVLLEVAGRRLRTMALAGTARSDEREVFGADDKEILEHEYVVRSLVAQLAGIGTVRRSARRVLDLGALVHFHTPIAVTLDHPQDPAGLVARLHPTPALGPLPRTAATLAMLEAWRDRLGCPAEFGAPFGLWHDRRFTAVVAIRGVWWEGREARLPAGCGVIEASRLVNEWRELQLKREAVKAWIEVAGNRGPQPTAGVPGRHR